MDEIRRVLLALAILGALALGFAAGMAWTIAGLRYVVGEAETGTMPYRMAPTQTGEELR